MMQPNFNLLLWTIIATTVIDSIFKILGGVIGCEKSQKYGGADIVTGLINLSLIAWVMIA